MQGRAFLKSILGRKNAFKVNIVSVITDREIMNVNNDDSKHKFGILSALQKSKPKLFVVVFVAKIKWN